MRSAARNAITLLALRSQSNTSKLLATPVDNVLGILLCIMINLVRARAHDCPRESSVRSVGRTAGECETPVGE